MSLKVENEEHLAAVKTFAAKAGRAAELQEKLDYLATYACFVRESEADEGHLDADRTRCVLYADGAPYSFGFTMMRRQADGSYTYWFAGGLLFHGSHDGFGSGSGPTYAVTLSKTDGWSIHT